MGLKDLSDHQYVIYARFSSHLQKARSIRDQVDLSKDYIIKHDGQIKHIFTDEAKSGKTLMARAGVLKLLETVKQGGVNTVICESLDRLSRDQEDIAKIYKVLSFYNVVLYTLGEGKIDELHIGLKGTMNALFLKDLAQKTKRGQIGKVREGFAAGNTSYGYRVKKEYDKEGEVIRGLREIVPEEAKIVIRIFEEYAGGLNGRQITRKLNADKVPGPRGNEWTHHFFFYGYH
jgi:DNA invertase Pin-like site-specific DNA recombinase